MTTFSVSNRLAKEKIYFGGSFEKFHSKVIHICGLLKKMIENGQ